MAAPAPTRRRTRRPRAEREAEILAAARAVFAEQGYVAAAVAEIAARAGVVEGTVYSYFESKRALLIAVMQGFYEDLIADTEAGLSAVRGTENRLRFVIRRHLDTFTSDLGLCRVVISEARTDTALYGEAILELNRRYTGLGLRVLEEGLAAGDLRPGIAPGVIRDLIYGGIEHAVWRSVFGDRALDAEHLANQLADAVLEGILVRPTESAGHVDRLERAIERLESHVSESSRSEPCRAPEPGPEKGPA